MSSDGWATAINCGEGACFRWVAKRPQIQALRRFRQTVLRLLRSRAGASSLATGRGVRPQGSYRQQLELPVPQRADIQPFAQHARIEEQIRDFLLRGYRLVVHFDDLPRLAAAVVHVEKHRFVDAQ
ncbi:hypothetical protein D3C87_1743110 [compost metagenome]